jgi:predicted metal-dependent phosphotriesterase family hydrolase
MRRVRTVLGDIAPDELGVTAAHEHLWCDQRLGRDPDFPSHGEKMVLRDRELVVAEAGLFREAGGKAVIEVTVHGWGRDVVVLADIARRTGLHVVATGGFYVEACHPDFVRDSTCDDLVRFLVGEITEGADGSAIRAGLLKASVSYARIEGQEEKCTRAVARAHLRTGAAITTHTSASSRFHIEGGNAGTMFLDLFEKEGVDLKRVIIGHCDENADLRQLVSLLERGAYVQFDVIGKEHWLLDATRADLIAALVAEGHGERLLLSSDRNRISELRISGGKGYDHVLKEFVPLLHARGIGAADIQRLLVTNPATIFSMPV